MEDPLGLLQKQDSNINNKLGESMHPSDNQAFDLYDYNFEC